MALFLAVAALAILVFGSPPVLGSKKPPTVSIRNGTLSGRYSSQYQQDYFLGVPFAQPPVGALRFRIPQSLNSTFDGTYEATEYASECYDYGVSA